MRTWYECSAFLGGASAAQILFEACGTERVLFLNNDRLHLNHKTIPSRLSGLVLALTATTTESRLGVE